MGQFLLTVKEVRVAGSTPVHAEDLLDFTVTTSLLGFLRQVS